jgi:copper(I)-binding protein
MRFEQRRDRRYLLACLSWLMIIAAVPAGAEAPTASATMALPRVDAAWIRWLPGTIPAAGYLTLTNLGDRPAALLSASSPAFGDVSLHRTESSGGSMQMKSLDRITIPAHATLVFETTGYHLMLMAPAAFVKPGVHLTITLQFAEAPPLPVDFEVRNPDGSRAR